MAKLALRPFCSISEPSNQILFPLEGKSALMLNATLPTSTIYQAYVAILHKQIITIILLHKLLNVHWEKVKNPFVCGRLSSQTASCLLV